MRASGLKLPARRLREEPPERRLLKTSNAKKVVFPQDSNLQPLDCRSTALSLELEKTSSHILKFGYLNLVSSLFYDFNNKSIMMFLKFDVFNVKHARKRLL